MSLVDTGVFSEKGQPRSCVPCDEELFLLSGLLRNLRLRSEIGDIGVGCVYSVLR